jgi:hypothetical protein
MSTGQAVLAPAAAAQPASPSTLAPPEATTSLASRRGRTLLLTFTSAHFAHHVVTSLLSL